MFCVYEEYCFCILFLLAAQMHENFKAVLTIIYNKYRRIGVLFVSNFFLQSCNPCRIRDVCQFSGRINYV